MEFILSLVPSRLHLDQKGRDIVLERNYGTPEVVNDGVTIAHEISLGDPEENVGATFIQEVASTFNPKAGYGAMTSTVNDSGSYQWRYEGRHCRNESSCS